MGDTLAEAGAPAGAVEGAGDVQEEQGGQGGGDQDGQKQDQPKAYDWTADPHGLTKLDLSEAPILGKFKSLQELEGGYSELQKALGARNETLEAKIAAKFAAPEKYDFAEFSLNPQMEEGLQAEFKARGFRQEQASWAVGALLDYLRPKSVEQGLQILGAEWGQEDAPLPEALVRDRIHKITQEARSKYGDQAVDWYIRTGGLSTPEALMRLEEDLKAQREGSSWQGGGGTDPQTLRAELAEIEKKLYDQATPAPERKKLNARRTEIFQTLFPEQ